MSANTVELSYPGAERPPRVPVDSRPQEVASTTMRLILTSPRRVIWLLLVCAAAGCDGDGDGGQGRDSHAHGAGSEHAHSVEGEEEEPIRLTLFTEKMELFMEYPPLVSGIPAEFLAHFSVLETGEPIRSGTLTVEVTPPGGAAQSRTLQAPKRDGLFVPEWTFQSAGTHRLRLTLDGPQVTEVIDVGLVHVHADEHEAQHAAESTPGEEPRDVVPFLMEQQWKVQMLLGRVERRTLVEHLVIPARIEPPQGASAVVSPPIAGRLLPPANGRLPRVGDQVTAGQVLAQIEPALPVTEVFQLSANRAQVQALETELALRELDLDTKALEVERSLIQSQARLEYARRANDRVASLRQQGVGTQQQYDEAVQNLRLAEA